MFRKRSVRLLVMAFIIAVAIGVVALIVVLAGGDRFNISMLSHASKVRFTGQLKAADLALTSTELQRLRAYVKSFPRDLDGVEIDASKDSDYGAMGPETLLLVKVTSGTPQGLIFESHTHTLRRKDLVSDVIHSLDRQLEIMPQYGEGGTFKGVNAGRIITP